MFGWRALDYLSNHKGDNFIMFIITLNFLCSIFIGDKTMLPIQFGFKVWKKVIVFMPILFEQIHHSIFDGIMTLIFTSKE